MLTLGTTANAATYNNWSDAWGNGDTLVLTENVVLNETTNVTKAFTGATATTVGIQSSSDNRINGTARYRILSSKKELTLSLKDITFANGYAIDVGGAIYAEKKLNLKLDGNVSFTNNTSGGSGSAINTGSNLSISGTNPNVTFSGNHGSSEGSGDDISAGYTMSITGGGQYTFGGSVQTYGELNVTKQGEHDLILTANGKSQYAGNAYSDRSYGTISSYSYVVWKGAKFANSDVVVEGASTVNGLLYGSFGIRFNNVTIENNKLTSRTSAAQQLQGLVHGDSYDTSSWKDTTRYTSISGTSVLSGNNVLASSNGSSVFGGVIASVAPVRLGEVAGSNVTFRDNKATVSSGSGEACGTAIVTTRTVGMTSSGNTLLFENNVASAVNGIARGGAIAVNSLYSDHSVGEFGVVFDGDNNDVTFIGNSATSTSGTGHGGAIAVFQIIGSATSPVVSLGGNGSTYTFTNNSASTAGGAIHSNESVNFSGTGTTATFSGNTAAGVANDIEALSVGITGDGDYTFGGGINADTMTVNGLANVTFGSGSTSSIDHFEIADEGTVVTLANGSTLNITGTNTLEVTNGGTLRIEDGAELTSVGDMVVDNSTLVLGINSESLQAVELSGFDVNIKNGSTVVLSFDDVYAPAEDQEIVLVETEDNIIMDDDTTVSYENAQLPRNNMMELIVRETEGGKTQLVAKIRESSTNVPEPATWVMMILGCAGLYYTNRKRRLAA